VVLMGPPNAGKSSLINALAGRDIAIVTPEPGTTRDVLEAWLDIDGFAVCVADTAGLREAAGIVEVEGIRRARGRAERADLILWLSPVDDPAPPDGLQGAGAPVWVLRSKDDLAIHGENGISVVREGGLGALTARLREFLAEVGGGAESVGVTRKRHRAGLERCAALLGKAAGGESVGIEVRAEWLREAGDCIGRLTGRIDVEEVLGSIFSEFCIGK
jgi:tRNA modification GTPase